MAQGTKPLERISKELDRNAALKAQNEKAAKPATDKQSTLQRQVEEKVIESKGDWYDDSGGGFWRWQKDVGWIGYTEAQYKRHLKVKGYFSTAGKDETASQVERILVALQHQKRVDFAGEIAGYKHGIHEICGSRILIPKGPQFPTPKRGRWDLIKTLIADLFRDQAVYFYSWIKAAFASLVAGAPFRPGQLLTIAGPKDCGKSLLQNLITEMLGGRSCKPYSYLTGKTDFNSHCFAAEHWMIEDEASCTDIRTRRIFGAMVKNVVVNEVQNFHAKGRVAFSTRPFVRMTMTLNDNPESLLVLPPLDEDVIDKVMLLQASQAKFPYRNDDLKGRQKYRDALSAEIPAFLSAMSRFEIPREIQGKRFGVVAYHDPHLLASVHSLAPESQLLQILDLSNFWQEYPLGWRGSAFELQTLFSEKKRDPYGAFARVCQYSTTAGAYLRRLAGRNDGRVKLAGGDDRCHVYDIAPPS